MRRVLVLRPEPGASATVERALRLGLEAFSIPLFSLEPIGWVAPDPASFDGLLLTSANAMLFANDKLEQLRRLPVYAVGEATAAAAREKGFDVASAGTAGIDSLLESLPSKLKLLHLCGEDKRAPIRARQAITSIPVYAARAVAQPDLSQAIGTIALVHSPRAARRFAELVNSRSSIAIAAISAAAAQAAGSGWEAVKWTSVPQDDALLALAARLCNIPDQE